MGTECTQCTVTHAWTYTYTYTYTFIKKNTFFLDAYFPKSNWTYTYLPVSGSVSARLCKEQWTYNSCWALCLQLYIPLLHMETDSLPRTAHPPGSFWASLEFVSLHSGQRFRLLVTTTPGIMPFDATPPSRHIQRPSLVSSMTFLPTPHFCQPLTPYFKEKHSPTLCVSFPKCRSHCLSPAWFSAELLDTYRVAGGLQSQNTLQPGTQTSLITMLAAVLRWGWYQLSILAFSPQCVSRYWLSARPVIESELLAQDLPYLGLGTDQNVKG